MTYGEQAMRRKTGGGRFWSWWLVLSFFLAAACACSGDGVVVRENPETYRVRFRFAARQKNGAPDRIIMTVPLPPSTSYQDVVVTKTPDGEIGTVEDTGDRYLQVRFSATDFAESDEVAVEYECEVTLYDVRTDFSRIHPILEYRKDTAYQYYTGDSKTYIQPGNPEIARIARSLGDEAKNPVDFARLAYDYVAKNYRYIDRTGFRPLSETLKDGGGHCGELSSIFISILRSHGIPARHLVGHLTDDKAHIISEFYIQDCGWIPVDVTYHKSRPKNDYFGRIPKKSALIALNRGLHIPLKGLSGTIWASSLQKGWANWSPKKAAFTLKFTQESEKFR